MEVTLVDEAIELLEKSNSGLEPELMDSSSARELLAAYDRAQRLCAYGVAALSRKLGDAAELAKVTGTSMGKAKETVATGEVLKASAELGDALRHGDISLDQASQIAVAEEACPGAAKELVKVAKEESFQVLRESARKVKLEAEQHRGLGERQRKARSARTYSDELGMVHIHLALEPHVGTPILARAEAEAARLATKAKRDGCLEPFERHLADAYASLLAGAGKGPAKRPELVVLVSHEVIRRGWEDVRAGEFCKIPGVGPVPPEVAKKIAEDANITGVSYDGTELRHMKRWTRKIPADVRGALGLAPRPP
jgi:hypothetical protein